MICFLDIESFSETPIKDGVHRYAEKAEIMIFTYALDDGPTHAWDATLPGAPFPADLDAALRDPAVTIVSHNASFERTLFHHAGGPLLQSVAADVKRWHCTMAQALAHSLPGALGKLCEVLGVDTDKAKDKVGKQLIQLLCKPRAANSKVRRATRETHPQEWARFLDYAKLDVVAMREVYKKLPIWNYKGRELELWRLDQRINDRGLCVDLPLAHAAVRAAARAQASLAAQTSELTDGAVASATQRDVLLKHILAEHGVALPDMQASTLERRIADPELPAAVRELLAIRLQASSTSVAKYQVLIRGASSDSRLRGTLQFCGASRTGRWAGRLFQPQNLPSRGLLPQSEIDFGIEAMLSGCEDLVFDNVMHLCSSAIRGCIVAPPGKKLVVADLANIEGRVLAWLAGENWKLQAFRDFDAGTGEDLYKLAYARSFGIAPAAVTKDQRAIGKVQELALGYAAGAGAFLTFSLAYGIDIEQMAEDAYITLPADLRTEAEEFLAWMKKQKKPTHGLSDRAFIVCDVFKRAWRRGHPQTVQLWAELEEAVRGAIQAPGVSVTRRRLKVRRDGNWLRVGLPSGRALCYPSPQVDEGGVISYMGTSQYTRQWGRLRTYSGKLVENCCQAVARDVMAHNMPAIEDAGYALISSIHDELPTEAPDSDEFSAEHLAALLATNPPWATDMPLAAEGFTAKRYRK